MAACIDVNREPARNINETGQDTRWKQQPSGEAMGHNQPQGSGIGDDGAGDVQLGNALDALSNLIYLAMQEADKPERVRFYLKEAEARIRALGASTASTNRS